MQFGPQGNLLAIDLGCHRMMAHIAMDGVGKIHDGGAARHRQDLAFWSENINGFRKQVNLDVVPEFGRVTRFLLNIEQ